MCKWPLPLVSLVVALAAGCGGPEAVRTAVSPAHPLDDDDLQARCADPRATFQWFRDGRLVAGQEGAVLSADLTTPGQSFRARAVLGDGSLGEASATVVVAADGHAAGDGADRLPGDSGEGDSALPGDGGDPGPLLVNGCFEEDLVGWEVRTGRCTVTEGRVDLLPYAGERYLFGGEGTPGDCLATQALDLVALGADPGSVDAGRVAVDIEAMTATITEEGGFDDQPRLRVAWLDGDGADLGSLETLAGSGDAWHVRGASGLVPPGARTARVEVEARFRRNPHNDAMVDAVQVALRPVEGADPALTRRPVLQDHRADTMRLLWETDGNLCDHAVAWGPAEGALSERVEAVRTIEVDAGHFVHLAEITGLEAGRTYQYRVESGGTVGETWTFRTAPAADAPTRFAFMADNQEGYERFATHVRHLAARAPDMLLVAGDLVQNMDQLREWREWWWQPLEEEGFGSTTPVMVARGNHDRHHPYAYAYTAMPEGEDFFSFRYGGVFFVVLDSQEPVANQPAPLDQQTYLAEALASEAARTADFRVVVFHQALFTNVRQDSSDGSAGGREAWLPLIEAGGVDLVVAGHYHSYQRGELDGVTHVVVGGGGSQLLQNPAEDLWAHMTLLERAWHYSVMDVDGADLTWTTYDLEDRVIDRFSLAGGPLAPGE